MGSMEEDFSRVGNLQMEDNREEKILVLVRLRPLSEKETVSNEAVDWECINNTTILYRNTLREGSTYPSAYTFDRVFRGDCSTRRVYDDGVKDVALSVVRGINASIFAYGQTSSGKTYTMMGITEYAISDVFDYMRQHEDRAFVLKFSAIEIYNEAIRDLLSTDSSSLRLLDDQEKGTVVEKVKEETLKNWDHLQELLSICEAQRRIGETSLNEKSSRSHQILRLTIESSAREFLNKESCATLSATVNFVDLAGSERASQAASSGARLKEGCHINRSLLTLGTVIRKLSKGRSGHVNYRDSKLTRLLQPALGGNARTAIVCTLSPARSHVEQTRNTLLFACCAKEVSTKAQVNVVMSDKALVKHLRREVARLESELRSPAPLQCSSAVNDIIKKKDLQIQKMEKQIRDLTMQRDLAESRVEDLLRIIGGHDQTPSKLEDDRDLDSRHSNGYCKEVQCIEVSPARQQISSSITFDAVPAREQISSSITFDAVRDTSSSAYDVLEERLHHVASALDDLLPPASEWTREQSGSPSYYEAESERMSRNLSHSSLEEATEIPTVENFVTEIKEMARQVTMGKEEESAYPFERKRKEIIEKWRRCHVSLVHRTYFFLLFKGEASDSIYMEVELKWLTFLEEQGRDLGGSLKRLKKERKMLSRLIKKRMTEDERTSMYVKWGIGLRTKRRRHQMAKTLWTADDFDHVRDSAAVVAKLVNFVQQGRALHGMFGLSFAPLSSSSCRRPYALPSL